MRTFEQMTPGYRNLWREAGVLPDKLRTVTAVGQAILDSKKRWYLDVETRTGVPWAWIACIHHRENGGKWGGALHNGEAIIGTGRKTTLVPKGRGPFDTWRESAVDALQLKKLHQIQDWPLERWLYEFERYNGWGYLGRINSPYLWAMTTKQQRGKYVKDGVYDAEAWDQQIGCVALLKVLVELDDTIKFDQAAPEPAIIPDPEPDEDYQEKRDRLIAELEALTGGKVAILFD